MDKTSEPFTVVYDTRDAQQRKRIGKHAKYWGQLYTEIDVLDRDTVALTFKPSPDDRWRPWERVRKGWILRDANPRQLVRLVEEGQ